MLVEPFVAKTPIGRFDEGVLCPLARRGVVPFDTGLFDHSQRGVTGQLGAA